MTLRDHVVPVRPFLFSLIAVLFYHNYALSVKIILIVLARNYPASRDLEIVSPIFPLGFRGYTLHEGKVVFIVVLCVNSCSLFKNLSKYHQALNSYKLISYLLDIPTMTLHGHVVRSTAIPSLFNWSAILS